MLVCGPLPVEQWARDGAGALASFAADGTYRQPPPPAAHTSLSSPGRAENA